VERLIALYSIRLALLILIRVTNRVLQQCESLGHLTNVLAVDPCGRRPAFRAFYSDTRMTPGYTGA
jgi:hypothetical protein